MKVKIKKMDKPSKTVVVSEDITSALEEFNAAFAQIGRVLLDRSEEIENLKLCILTGHHMMLEGPQGTAKSKLARMAFSCIEGSEFFVKQFMKTTQPDEIFGPMIAEEYKKGIWRHNIEGMLPTAHFALLDEVYRASDMALPSMMGILNERMFINGTEEVQCPLITAVGTTNFTTENEELNAFHDRWLVKVKVEPLSSPSSRIKMLLHSLEGAPVAVKPVSLDSINLLREAVLQTQVEEGTIEIYEQAVATFRRKTNAEVSDRRLVQAFMLVRAAAVLSSEDGSVPEVTPEHLAAACSGICVLNDKNAHKEFTDALGTSLGQYSANKSENASFSKLTKFVEELKVAVRKVKSDKDGRALRDKIGYAYAGLTGMQPDEEPKLAHNVDKCDEAKTELAAMLTELEKRYGKLANPAVTLNPLNADGSDEILPM